VEYLFLLSKDLGYLSKEKYSIFSERIEEIKRMLASLQRKVKESK